MPARGIESTATAVEANPFLDRFLPRVAGAIQEERTMRTQGASIWDTVDRISFGKLVCRVILTCFAGLGYFVARCWQSSRDAQTIRPRALRFSKDGSEVYGGTAERSAGRRELRATIRQTKEALETGAAPEPPEEQPIEYQDLVQIRKHLVNGKPLEPYIRPLLCTARQCLRDFVLKKSDFVGASFDFSRGLINPNFLFDEKTQEIFIEIEEDGQVGLGGKSGTFESRMMVRISLQGDLDVDIISLEATERSVPEPTISVSSSRKNKSVDGDAVKTPLRKEVEQEALPLPEPMDFPFCSQVQAGLDLARGWDNDPTADGLSQFMSSLQERWDARESELRDIRTGAQNPEDAQNPAYAASVLKNAEIFEKIKSEVPDWSFWDKESKALLPEAKRNPEMDLRVASVLWQRPVIIISCESDHKPSKAVCYNADWTVSEYSPEAFSTLLDESFEDAPVCLRKQEASWQAVHYDDLKGILTT